MAAEPFSYTAEQLFDWIAGKPDFVLLDVRNEKEFANWYVEGPSFFPYINVPYFNFMEDLQESISMIPAGEKIRIVCSKEGSAKYVAEQLTANGFTDVGYLKGQCPGRATGHTRRCPLQPLSDDPTGQGLLQLPAYQRLGGHGL